MKRFLAWAAVAIALVVAIGAVVVLTRTPPSPVERTADLPGMVRQIQQLSELVTVKYSVQKVIGLEEAVRRMTSLSCDRFGLVDRGRIGEGLWADLVLFDPDTVADAATYDDPKVESTGVRLVAVAGHVTLVVGRHTGAGAGRLLRHRDGG